MKQFGHLWNLDSITNFFSLDFMCETGIQNSNSIPPKVKKIQSWNFTFCKTVLCNYHNI